MSLTKHIKQALRSSHLTSGSIKLEGNLLKIKNLSMLEEQGEDHAPGLSADLIEGLKPFCLWLHPYLSEYLKMTMSAQDGCDDFSFDEQDNNPKSTY